MIQARGQKAIPSIFRIIDAESEIDPTEEKGEKASVIEGRIEFRNVKFAYPARKGKVLRDISFTVEPGQTVALVGGSGSGKSTIFALLQRFYDLEDGNGEILIDGKPIKSYNLQSLRQIFGFVEQEPRLFGTTIMKNLCYGNVHLNPDATPQLPEDSSAFKDVEKAELSLTEETNRKIEAAIDVANAGFVRDLGDKYETHVGEVGKGVLSINHLPPQVVSFCFNRVTCHVSRIFK